MTKFQTFWGVLASLLCVASAFAQDKSITVNETEGFGAGQLLVFTYLQEFYCTHEAFDDLNHNGKVSAIDPFEFQRPICAVGEQPKIDPTGVPVSRTEKLYVISPFFGNDKNPNDAFSVPLGNALLGLFHFIPEAFKTHPAVDVQCPEPGQPENKHKGMPGTCTMHTTQLDLGPVLAKLGKVPPNTNVFVPTLNHSHVIDETVKVPVWWQIISVLVTDPSAWPNAEGTRGITSVEVLRQAQKDGKAGPDSPTNFFLFFGVHPQNETE